MKHKDKNTDKLTDKAFSRMLFTSLLGIFVCIVCLGSSTWAWFSDVSPSCQNEIRTADSCLLSVSVKDPNGAELENTEDGVTLTAGDVYTVTLSLPKDSASGYCMLTAGETAYYSDYIVRHESETPHTVSFTVTVSKTQEVVFTARWGIYTRDSDVVNGSLVIP